MDESSDRPDDGFDVTRQVELDLPAEELLRLVADGASWGQWLADESEVDVVPGGGGRLVDDGEEREVRIERVDADGVAFVWWPTAEPARRSVVELVVDRHGRRSALRIRERFDRVDASAVARASAGDRSGSDGLRAPGGNAIRWEVRIALLWVRAMLGHPTSVAR